MKIVLRLDAGLRNFRRSVNNEEGQDLVEYALVVALIAFGAIVGMGTLASGINTAFNNIAGYLSSTVT